MEINILVHGNSEGFNSEFMQYLFTSLKKAKKEVFGFDFEYIENNTSPSVEFKDEINKLETIIEEYKSKGYTKINLIGKSLGGILCLNKLVVTDSCVNKIIVVGFPYLLGFPANLELLKSKPVLEGSSTFLDYKNHLLSLESNLSKLTIVQGENDLLGSLEKINKLIKETGSKINLYTVKNASHGFKPIDSSTTIEENNTSVINNILQILN